MKPKILFISGNLFPSIAGDSIFSQGLIERLLKIATVDVCSYGTDHDIENSNFCDRKKRFTLLNKKVLKAAKWTRILRFGSVKQVYSKELCANIKEKLKQNNYSFVVVDHLRAYTLIKPIYKFLRAEKIKLIYMAHNIEYVNLNESIQYEMNWFKKVNLRLSNLRLKKLEFDLLQKADIIWTLSNNDRDILQSIAPKTTFKLIKPYFNWELVKQEKSLKRTSKKLMILGSMNWYPNVIGTLHFVEKVFNELLKTDPDYKLYIVGQRPDQKIKALNSDAIIVTGKVTSVDEYINLCDLLIIPNKLGSGIKIKFYESITKGLPVVSYPENTIGYESEMLKYPFVVLNECEFKNAIGAIILDFELKKQFLASFDFDNTLKNSIFNFEK